MIKEQILIAVSINSLTTTKAAIQFTNIDKYLSKSAPIPFKCPFTGANKQTESLDRKPFKSPRPLTRMSAYGNE